MLRRKRPGAGGPPRPRPPPARNSPTTVAPGQAATKVRDAPLACVRARAALQPVIKRRCAACEGFDLVAIVQKDRSCYASRGMSGTVPAHYRSHGGRSLHRVAEVCRWAEAARRGLRGTSRMRPRQPRTGCARSRPRHAARRAASSTKSVRVLPVSAAARSIRPRSSGLMRRFQRLAAAAIGLCCPAWRHPFPCTAS